MDNKQSNNEKIDSPIIFWSSIGVCIGCSTAVTMKLESYALILSGVAGLLFGLAVGYNTKKKPKIKIIKTQQSYFYSYFIKLLINFSLCRIYTMEVLKIAGILYRVKKNKNKIG